LGYELRPVRHLPTAQQESDRFLLFKPRADIIGQPGNLSCLFPIEFSLFEIPH
jgi:hypothetical protein